ncbi:MAG: MOSC domain-containing protein [Chloroflexi bacterium]|nr:MOSC domain-containing protein [Chloroflexota bacterium]
MMLLSVNFGQLQAVDANGRQYQTGIYKSVQMGQIWLRRLGLQGDAQADLKAHGGPHRAIYCYAHENYSYWAAQLGRRDFRYGQFGENLTTLGLLESQACIGDIYRIGGALIQVSQPRVPCYKLADKMGIAGFEKTFLAANRPGFYARVLQEGRVEAGEPIALVERSPAELTVTQVNAALYLDKSDRDTARRARKLASLSPGWRASFEKLLSASV